MRRGDWLTRPVRRWVEAREKALAMRTCGGDQRCPWCQRWMNQSTATFICPFDFATDSPELDEIVCGHCGGTSLWKWEIGFIFVMRGDPPPAPPCGYGDGEFIRRIVSEATADLAERGGFAFPAESRASSPSEASAGNLPPDEPKLLKPDSEGGR